MSNCHMITLIFNYLMILVTYIKVIVLIRLVIDCIFSEVNFGLIFTSFKWLDCFSFNLYLKIYHIFDSGIFKNQ